MIIFYSVWTSIISIPRESMYTRHCSVQRDMYDVELLIAKRGGGPIWAASVARRYLVRGCGRLFALHSRYPVPAPKLSISPDFPHSATPPHLEYTGSASVRGKRYLRVRSILYMIIAT